MLTRVHSSAPRGHRRWFPGCLDVEAYSLACSRRSEGKDIALQSVLVNGQLCQEVVEVSNGCLVVLAQSHNTRLELLEDLDVCFVPIPHFTTWCGGPW